MTACNGCGDHPSAVCCDPVVSVFSPTMLADGSLDAGQGGDSSDVAWMRKHLTPILPRRRGLDMVRGWSSGLSEIGEVDHRTGRVQLHLIPAWYYSCEFYDATHKRCLDYDNRPAMCRDYPWYGDPPDPSKVLPPTCSYRVDVGRTVETSVDLRVDGTRGRTRRV